MSKTGISSVAGDHELGDTSVQRASVIAGSGLLLMAVLAAFTEFVVLEEFVTQGSATQTATDILSSERMFHFGIVSLFVVAVLDVVVAWALFTVFEPVSRSLSLLAAWFRVVYAGVLLVAISELMGALHLLNNADSITVLSTAQVHAQVLLDINAFYDIRYAGLILFGLHLLVLGYLAYRADYATTFLGALLAIAGLGYVIDSVGPVLSPGYSVELVMFVFIGEVVLIFWLLIKGRRIVLNNPTASPAD